MIQGSKTKSRILGVLCNQLAASLSKRLSPMKNKESGEDDVWMLDWDGRKYEIKRTNEIDEEQSLDRVKEEI